MIKVLFTSFFFYIVVTTVATCSNKRTPEEIIKTPCFQKCLDGGYKVTKCIKSKKYPTKQKVDQCKGGVYGWCLCHCEKKPKVPSSILINVYPTPDCQRCGTCFEKCMQCVPCLKPNKNPLCAPCEACDKCKPCLGCLNWQGTKVIY